MTTTYRTVTSRFHKQGRAKSIAKRVESTGKKYLSRFNVALGFIGNNFYTVLADSETFGTDLGPMGTNDSDPDVCCGGNVNEAGTGKSACC